MVELRSDEDTDDDEAGGSKVKKIKGIEALMKAQMSPEEKQRREDDKWNQEQLALPH